MDDALVKFLWGNEQFEEDYVTCPWCKYQTTTFASSRGLTTIGNATTVGRHSSLKLILL